MPKKVVIRINNARPIDSSDGPDSREIVVYHWRRIFTALALGLTLLGGAIWAGWQALKAPEETRVVDLTPDSDVNATGSSASPSSPPKQQAGKAPAAESAGAPSSAGQLRSDARPSANKHEGKQSEGRSLAGMHGHPAVSILSKSIRRAQLASAVVGDEPVDMLDAVIPMSDKGLIRIYLFTETTGLKGKTLFHDWYWKDKRMAHARIPIRQNTHKAASSKFIDRIMVGPWEVRVVDEKDRVLAKASFEVR
jgi:hypothetical protein